MHIKAHFRSLGRKYGLRRWVDGSDCPLKEYFESVDEMIKVMERHTPASEPVPLNWDTVAGFMATLLDREGALFNHVDDDSEMEITDEELWKNICLSAAYIILEKYEGAGGKERQRDE